MPLTGSFFWNLAVSIVRYASGQDHWRDFGLAETAFTPFFMRFWFLEYYENFDLPSDERYDRGCLWCDACLSHPVA